MEYLLNIYLNVLFESRGLAKLSTFKFIDKDENN